MQDFQSVPAEARSGAAPAASERDQVDGSLRAQEYVLQLILNE